MTIQAENELDRILADLLEAEDDGIVFDEMVLMDLPPSQMVAVAEFLSDHRGLIKEFGSAVDPAISSS